VIHRRTISADETEKMRPSYPIPQRRGIGLVYTVLTLAVVMAFVSMIVDYGRVQLVKTQLQRTADAAARAAASQISSGITATQNEAVAIAADNNADDSPVVLDPNNDIAFGTWNSTNKTFTVLTGSNRSSANAIQITCQRIASRGTAIPLFFASLIGRSTCDVSASAIALATTNNSSQLTILNSLQCTNQPFIASYDSSQTTAPVQSVSSTWGSNVTLGCNGMVGQGEASAGTLNGNLSLGPTGSKSAFLTVTGTTTNLGSPIPTPAEPTMQVVTNPGGVSQTPNLAKNAVVNWPGGTYYFTSFVCDEAPTINFTGPAIVYMNGNFTADKKTIINPYQNIPGNLIWYQSSGHTFSCQQNSTVTMDFYGPNANFSSSDVLDFMGGMVCNTFITGTTLNLFYDVRLGGGSAGGTAISLVK
jgi:Flp pilus assembly protein TadG